MPSSDEYKRQINQDLARGNVDSLGNSSTESVNEYENFDDFAQRSSRDERRQLFGRSFHPDRVPSNQMEPELQKAIAQIRNRRYYEYLLNDDRRNIFFTE